MYMYIHVCIASYMYIYRYLRSTCLLSPSPSGGHVFITEKQGFQIELLTVNGGGRGSLLDIRDAMRRTGSLVLDRPGDLAFDSDAK